VHDAHNDLDRLLAAVAKGDGEAFGLLYDRAAGHLLALIRRIVVDADLAEDVLQEVFWQVWQRASSFDPAKGSAKAWLAVLARRRAIDCVRSRESRRLREASSAKFEVEYDSVAEAVFSHERSGEVARAVAGLDQPVRSCIDAVFFRSMTHVQAAQALNMPLGTLKTHIRKGIAQLREVVEDR
jgi:RNA polymerase sigma factor, sigma-70 family